MHCKTRSYSIASCAPKTAWTLLPTKPGPFARLAEVSGVSEAHFARSFKQAFGIPPHRCLLTRRIEQATTLLRDTDLPITDIAFAAGWVSVGGERYNRCIFNQEEVMFPEAST